MSRLNILYRQLFIAILALYIYLGKGIAYSFLAEVVLLFGLLIVIKDRNKFPIITSKNAIVLYLFLGLNLLYLFKGIMGYSIIDTIRDSFVLNYIIFAFLVLLFFDNVADFIIAIANIYKYYPIVIFTLYLLSQNEFFGSISLFGGYHILFFKFGDICVHLFISFVFQLTGLSSYKKPFDLLNYVLIILMFSIATSYSRGGMLSFFIGFIIFYYFVKEVKIKQELKRFVKYLPIVFVISILFLLNFSVDENFQGRKVGVEQVASNFTSVFSESEEGGLNDNKVWRLLWWTQIVDYTFNGPYFLAGKGLGMSLASDDDIVTTDLDAELRSPHNFHLTILARYGVPIFIMWIFWLVLQFKRLKLPSLSKMQLVFISIQAAFLFNATFDVFLEGPMGAFPFWVFVGIDLIFDFFKLYGTQTEDAIFKQNLKAVES